MPPKKPRSTVKAEDSLAARIALERERREWTPAELAEWMRKAGCPMTQSGIWKIENGHPRRRITFDEAVSFAKVFGMTLEDLAQPPEVVAAERVGDRLQQLREEREMRVELFRRWEVAIEEIGDAIADDPTGLVAVTINRFLNADEDEFPVALWQKMDQEAREVVAESWKDICVEERGVLHVELLRPQDLKKIGDRAKDWL